MTPNIHSNIHNEIHEKFSTNNNSIKMKNLLSNQIYNFNYISDKKYFIFQDKINRIILDYCWSNDGIVFADPLVTDVKYEII